MSLFANPDHGVSVPVLVLPVTAAMSSKSTECYMNLLYTMEDVAVYGYMTPLKVKIIIALALTDAVVRDADVLTVCCNMNMTVSLR